MSNFKPFEPSLAYLKIGIHGFTGAGKTFGSALIAMGLHDYLQSKKPIFFLDTEGGANFVEPFFRKANVPLWTHHTRSFADLLDAMLDAEKTSDILIIDSITHFWLELQSAYKKKHNRTHLMIKDWSVLKPEWAEFLERYTTSKIHAFMVGRAGWEFMDTIDEEGTKEFTKTGTKMKVEGESAFEPNLSLEMEKLRIIQGKAGSSYKHRCWITKDKTNQLNGAFKDFLPVTDDKLDLTQTNPLFQFILPHIVKINIGGQHNVLNPAIKTESMFNTDKSAFELGKKREIILEEIKAEIMLRFPGRDADTSKEKINLLKEVFSTPSWAAIENFKYDELVKYKQLLMLKFAEGAHA